MPTLATSSRARPRHHASRSGVSAGEPVRPATRDGWEIGSAITIHSRATVTTQLAPGWQVAGSIRVTSNEAGPGPGRGVAASSRVR